MKQLKTFTPPPPIKCRIINSVTPALLALILGLTGCGGGGSISNGNASDIPDTLTSRQKSDLSRALAPNIASARESKTSNAALSVGEENYGVWLDIRNPSLPAVKYWYLSSTDERESITGPVTTAVPRPEPITYNGNAAGFATHSNYSGKFRSDVELKLTIATSTFNTANDKLIGTIDNFTWTDVERGAPNLSDWSFVIGFTADAPNEGTTTGVSGIWRWRTSFYDIRGSVPNGAADGITGYFDVSFDRTGEQRAIGAFDTSCSCTP